jgi:membrane protein
MAIVRRVTMPELLVPASAVETLRGPIENLASSGSTGVIVLVVGLLGPLWTASGYVGALTKASNVAYEVPEGRPIWKLKPLQMLTTLVTVLLVAIVLVALIVTGPLARGVGEAIGLGSTVVTIYDYAKWPIMALLVLAILGILYYATPNARLPKLPLRDEPKDSQLPDTAHGGWSAPDEPRRP